MSPTDNRLALFFCRLCRDVTEQVEVSERDAAKASYRCRACNRLNRDTGNLYITKSHDTTATYDVRHSLLEDYKELREKGMNSTGAVIAIAKARGCSPITVWRNLPSDR